MAYKLTEEAVYKIESMILSDYSAFEESSSEQIVHLAFWTEGVKDMTKAVVNAIKELNK